MNDTRRTGIGGGREDGFNADDGKERSAREEGVDWRDDLEALKSTGVVMRTEGVETPELEEEGRTEPGDEEVPPLSTWSNRFKEAKSQSLEVGTASRKERGCKASNAAFKSIL